ncbi:MAG: hypothetical protein ACQET7_09565 [Thermodesulfobacteriota bacterium]
MAIKNKHMRKKASERPTVSQDRSTLGKAERSEPYIQHGWNSELERKISVRIECNCRLDPEVIYNTICQALFQVQQTLFKNTSDPIIVCLQDLASTPYYYKKCDLGNVILLHKAHLLYNTKWNNQHLLHELVHCVAYNGFSKLLSEGLAVYVSHILTDRPVYPTSNKDLEAALSSISEPLVPWSILIQNEESKGLFLLNYSNRRSMENLYIQAGVLVNRLVQCHGIRKIVEYICNLHEDLQQKEFMERLGLETGMDFIFND